MSFTFLNSSVVDFNIKGDMGAEVSLDVNTVECEFTNPTFAHPEIGSPLKFSAGSTNFYGILDTVKKNDNYTYSAQLTNGSFIIGGVELILNDYYGSVNAVPNLINIFGYMENLGGFGASNINNAGMSWADIATTVVSVVNNISGSSYGGPITYKGYKYKLNLSNLPNIPTYYRINSGSINLLDFVGEVCSAGGHDFYIVLEEPTSGDALAGWSGTFVIKTMSRISEPIPGKVQEFIESAGCVVNKNFGLETRKDVHSKFVVGANLERIYFNYPQNTGDNSFDGGFIDSNEYMNDTILPFFGVDVNNNIITGFTPSGEPNEYYFNIDVSDLKDVGQFECIGFSGGQYLTCLSELKSARKGRSSWEVFLAKRAYNAYVIESSGIMNSYFNRPIVSSGEITGYKKLPKYGYTYLQNIGKSGLASSLYPSGTENLSYPHNSNENNYFLRADALKISSGAKIGLARMLESDLYIKSTGNEDLQLAYDLFKAEGGILAQESQALQKDNIDLSSRVKDLGQSFNDNVTDKVFRKLKGLADTYYNRKFMVSIPFTLGTIEPESTNIRMSQEPINEGYLDESAWPIAYSSGLIPDISGINTLITADNKFYPFVKYEDCVVTRPNGKVFSSLYDFSEISDSDKIFGTPKQFTDASGVSPSGYLAYDCWIKCSVDEKIYFHDSQTLFGPRAIIEIPGSVKKYIGPDAASYGQALIEYYNLSKGVGGVFASDPNVNQDFFRKQFDKVGADDSYGHDGEPIQYADLYAIPLRSRILSYGPWYAVGADGKVSYERNTELNPWNYGGFTAMNTAGLARVQDGVTNQTFSEAGSVTVQGLPNLAFGDPLIASGPYVTSINCSIGPNGKQTTYSFQAWSSHRTLGKLTGQAIERNKNLSRTMREVKSNFREGLKNGRFKGVGDFYNKVSGRIIDLNDYTRRDRPSTSSKILSGEMNGPSATVVVQPNYNAAAQAYTDYDNKAFVSLDGIFRPYSTVPKSGWPSFESPQSSGSGEINSITLNPTQRGHDFSALSVGSGIQESGSDGLAGLLPMDYSGVIEESGFIPARSMAIRMPMVGAGWGFDTDGNPVPSGTGENGFAPDYLSNSTKWKAGPIDLRWDNSRGVWVGGSDVKIYLSKVTNTYNPTNYSYEVERSNSRDQFTRIGPTIAATFNPSGTIYDPEYLAYIANPNNVGSYEQLDYNGLEFPHYEAFIIRETNTDVGNTYYNNWSEDCQDCGHVSNPCVSGAKIGGHGTSSVGKKILIENPLKQSLDAGDLAFTVKTGRKKKVNTGNFINGSGTGAIGHVSINSSGVASFIVESGGSDYIYGGFGIINSGICASLNLIFNSGTLTSGTVSPSGGYPKDITYDVSIYPTNVEIETEKLDIHWILQAEFKTTQVNTYVGCDGGLLQTCSVKIQTQGGKSCEYCGEDTALINSF
jgi:hypothetical protein